MAGNYNSDFTSPILSGPGFCSCEDAPEPVFADQCCGEFIFISANLPDENVTGEQMNRYAQNSIDHIDNNLSFWESQGLPNAAVGSVKYYGTVLNTTAVGITGPAQVRYHNCIYKIGTRN